MDDVKLLVGQFLREDLYKVRLGRSHRAFPDISGNPFSGTDQKKT